MYGFSRKPWTHMGLFVSAAGQKQHISSRQKTLTPDVAPPPTPPFLPSRNQSPGTLEYPLTRRWGRRKEGTADSQNME